MLIFLLVFLSLFAPATFAQAPLERTVPKFFVGNNDPGRCSEGDFYYRADTHVLNVCGDHNNLRVSASDLSAAAICAVTGTQSTGYVLTATDNTTGCGWQAAGAASVDASVIKNAWYIADGGAANGITGTPTTTFPGAYAAGQSVLVKMNATNTGATTINVNSLGTKAVTKNGATALAAGNLVSGNVYLLTYDGTRFQVANFTMLATDVPTLNQNTTGTAALATALASNPANCSAGTLPRGVDASGVAEGCAAVNLATETTGAAPTASALAANPANCSAGNLPRGVDASGVAEGCAPVDLTAEVGSTKLPASNANASILDASVAYCADAGASDTYACNLSPAPAAYVTGARYRFKANTANTGTASINFNALGAKTIVKAAGGVTTTLADNDIRVGQVVELSYDGTNMQMQSLLGNAPSGAGTGCIPSGSVNGVLVDNGSGSCLTSAVTIDATAGLAGGISMPQGTAKTPAASNIVIEAPTAVTAYRRDLPGTVGSTGIVHETVAGSVQTETVSQVVAADTDTSIAHTGVDINTSHQITATHLGSPLPIAQGGTAGTDAADNGGIVYSNASQYKILAHTTTAGLALLSGNNTLPSWSAAPPVLNTRLISTTSPLAGGGDLSADRTFTCTTCVTSGASLTSGVLMTGAAGQASQTPCATCSLDSSGNLSSPGTASFGVGGSVGGVYDMSAGSSATVGANVFGWGAPATMTASVRLVSPNAVPGANQVMLFPAPTSNVSSWTWTSVTGTGLFAMATSPAFTTDIHCASAGGCTLGTNALPASSVYVGGSATNNWQVTGTATGARTATISETARSVFGNASATAASNVAMGTTVDVLAYQTAEIPAYVFVTADFTTSGSGTALEAITGLSWTMPGSTALNIPFHCALIWHQNAGNATVAFGTQNATTGPTNYAASGAIWTSATAATQANVVANTATTAVSVVSAAGATITTNWNATLDGLIEQPSGTASVFTIRVSTSTAADTVTVKRGSFCRVG